MGARIRDWLIGAVAMLVLVVVALGVAWWQLTEPAGEQGGAAGGDQPAAPPAAPAEPPADLGEDEIWMADVDLDAGTLVLPDSTLTDVVATGHGVRSGPDRLVARHLDVVATVPFQDIEAELGGDTQVRSAGNGEAAVRRSVPALGLLDRELSVVATGTVEVVDGLLVVNPTAIDLGGPDILARATADLVRRTVTIEHAIEGLPDGLVLLDVAVQEDGFRAELSGEEVVLVQAGTTP